MQSIFLPIAGAVSPPRNDAQGYSIIGIVLIRCVSLLHFWRFSWLYWACGCHLSDDPSR